MDLIDIREPDAKARADRDALMLNARAVAHPRQAVATAGGELERIPGVAEEIRQIEKLLSHERIMNHQLWERDKRSVQRLASALGEGERRIAAQYEELIPTFEAVAAVDSPGIDVLRELDALAETLTASLRAKGPALAAEIAEAAKNAAPILERWMAAAQEEQGEYEAAIAELDRGHRHRKPLTQAHDIEGRTGKARNTPDKGGYGVSSRLSVDSVGGATKRIGRSPR